MKKSYKLVIDYDDESEEVDGLSEVLEGIGGEGIWLDTGEETIRLPKEVAEYIELNGILGMA